MKKIIYSCFFVFLGLFTGLTAYASNVSEQAEDLLKNLDIVQENYVFSDNMTRSEFAGIIARIFKNDTADYSSEQYFSDVTASSVGKSAANDINKSAVYGIMNGISNTMFLPDEKLTSDDAAAALVRMLGYDEWANNSGGYPNGYKSTATEIGIFDGISAGDKFGEQIAIMVKNALEIDIVEYDNSKYEIKSGKNILNSVMRIDKYTGQIKAVGQTALSSDTAVNYDITRIGEKEFTAGEEQKAALREALGMSVDAYYEENSSGDDEIVYFRARGKEDVIEINIDTDTKIEQGRITYVDENGKERTKNLAAAPYIVYNNRPLSSIPSIGTAGSIKLIGENSKYNIIIIKDYQTYVVQDISLQNKKIISKYGGKFLDLNDPEELAIHNADGKDMRLEDINPGNVLSVICSNDGEYIDITVCTKSFYGRIDKVMNGEFGEYGLEISAYLYGVTEDMYEKLRFENSEKLLSVTGDFSVDIFGRIADFEYGASAKRMVGYMLRAWKSEDQETAQIRIFTTAGKFETLTLNRKLRVNGGSEAAPDSFVNMYNDPQLVSYTLNSDGEIKKIYTAVDLAEDSTETEEGLYRINSTPVSNMIYRSYQKSFNSQVIVNDSLVSFIIPSNSSDTDNEGYYMLERLNNYSSGTEYNNMTFYKFDPDSLKADVIVRLRDFTGFINEETPVLVEDIATAVSKDNEIVDQLRAFNESGSITYMSRSDATLKTVQNGTETIEIGAGDIVRCAINPLNEVGKLELVYSYDEDKYYSKSNPLINDSNQSFRYGLGTAVKRDGSIIKVRYRSGTVEYFDISNSKMLVVTEGRGGKVTIENGDMSDIITEENGGTPSTLFIYSPRNNPSLIYVYN